MEIRTDVSAQTALTADLQSMLRTNPFLRLEFLASLSKLFREHEIPVAPEVLSRLTLTLEGVNIGAALAGDPPPASGGNPPSPHAHEEEAAEMYG